MANRIPDEVIDRIRHSVDIVDVISDYVQLKTRAQLFWTLSVSWGKHTIFFSIA